MGGDKNFEKSEGVGVWGRAVPSTVGGLGACPQKNINFALKLCNSDQVLALLSYITALKWGIIPSPKSGGPIPYPPAPTPMTVTVTLRDDREWTERYRERRQASQSTSCYSAVNAHAPDSETFTVTVKLQ